MYTVAKHLVSICRRFVALRPLTLFMLKAAAAEIDHLETAFRRMAQQDVLFKNEGNYERFPRRRRSGALYLRFEIAMDNPVVAHDLQ